MFEKKFLQYLENNNLDIDLLIKKDKVEEDKFKATRTNSKLINSKTLSLMIVMFLPFPMNDGDIIFCIESNNGLVSQEDLCLTTESKCVNKYTCRNCKVSSLSLCVNNNIYKHGGQYIKKKEI